MFRDGHQNKLGNTSKNAAIKIHPNVAGIPMKKKRRVLNDLFLSVGVSFCSRKIGVRTPSEYFSVTIPSLFHRVPFQGLPNRHSPTYFVPSGSVKVP